MWLGGGEIRYPQETCLPEIERDRNRSIKREQKRHLNQQRQTAAKRIALLHQSQLLHLQFFHAGIILFHPLHLLLQLFHLRRKLLRLFHRFRRAPLQRKEKRVDDDREEDNREPITSGCFVEIRNCPKNRYSERA